MVEGEAPIYTPSAAWTSLTALVQSAQTCTLFTARNVRLRNSNTCERASWIVLVRYPVENTSFWDDSGLLSDL
jgi:hypothetical protein